MLQAIYFALHFAMIFLATQNPHDLLSVIPNAYD